MTRKSTPKWNVIHTSSGQIITSGVSRTDATKIARGMPGCRARPAIDRRAQ